MSEDKIEAGEGKKPGALEGVRARVLAHPGTSLLMASALTLLVAAAVAVPFIVSKSSELSDTKTRLSATSDELALVSTERDEAVAAAAEIESRRDEIISSAQDKSREIVDETQDKVRALKGRVKEAKAELSSTQAALAAVSASLESAREAKRMSTFSDGTWSVGDDILAGTYRSTAGGSCYWEILNEPSSGSIYNIVANGFGPNAVISVTDGQWLRVSGCGKWDSL